MNRTILGLVLALAACCPRLQAQVGLTSTNSSATGTNSAIATSGLTIAPYVQVLSPESVAILWQTAQPAYGWVEYGPTRALGSKQDAVVNGLRVANVTEHRVVLAGLRPGTTYWYGVRFKPIRAFGPYKVDFDREQHSEAAAFRTLPGPEQKVTTVIFNDLHNNLETFHRLCLALGETPFDFSMFNGDCISEPADEKQVVALLAAYTAGVQAGSRPAFFLRGNHDVRGAFARELPRLLAWPGDKPYFAFTAGTVRFVVLDCGEDKPDDHREYSGLVDFTSFRREETEWLKSELTSPAFRNATWRVLVHHIPLYKSDPRGGPTYSESCQALWGDLLANANVDIAINGHTHIEAFHPVNTIGNPYPIAVGGGPRLNRAMVMILEADSQQLKLRMLDSEEHEVFPAFEKKK